MLTENEKRDVEASSADILELIKVAGKHTQARGYLNDLGEPTAEHWNQCKALLYEIIDYKKFCLKLRLYPFVHKKG